MGTEVLAPSQEELLALENSSRHAKISPERFAVLWFKIVAAKPHQKLPRATMEIFYERLQRFTEAELEPAIGAELDRTEWPSIAGIIAQINAQRPPRESANWIKEDRPMAPEEAQTQLRKILDSLPASEEEKPQKLFTGPHLSPIKAFCCVCGVQCVVPFAEPELKMVICEGCNR